MPGAKIPVLEIENLFLKEDGRGLVVYDDATNFVVASASPWTGVSSNCAGGSVKQFFPCASSAGWLKVHYVSSSTFGATGAAGYIPIFRNLNTKTI
jgi:hypothetical protein